MGQILSLKDKPEGKYIGTIDETLPKDKNNLVLMKPYILNLCKQYLSGVWNQVKLDDFKIYKPCGGVSNHLFKCEITNNDLKPVRTEPVKIFVRIYGDQIHKNIPSMINDIMVTTVMSNFKIGPKLYGVFPSGRLEELIDAAPLPPLDVHKPDINRKIAIALADHHSLQMPFEKKPNHLFNTVEKNMKQVKQVNFANEQDYENYKKMMYNDLWEEFCELWKVIKSLDSLVTFSHNDCNPGNILELEDKLMLIDYEYGCYNYRAYDIANIFCEMMYDNDHDKHPYYLHDPALYPSEDMQANFIEAYIEKFKANNTTLVAEDPSINDKERLLNEVNHFVLVSHLYWTIWSLMMYPNPSVQFDYLGYGAMRCEYYFRQKKLLFPNGYNHEKESDEN